MITRGREIWASRIILIVMMLVTVVPFVALFITALHPQGTIPNGLQWPEQMHWGNFITAFHAANMWRLLQSSTAIVLGVVPVCLLIATMAGFALGHLRPPGGRLIFLAFIVGLTLPFQAVIIPMHGQIRDMGLLNTRWAVILPLWGLFMPFSVMWMRAHFVNMPEDLSEAARIDGANTWQLFWKIHVPLSIPAVSSLAILLFLWTWNQFLLPLVMIFDPTQRTMAGALGAFQGQWGTDIPLLSAGSVLILAPSLAVFLIFQRKFVSSLMQGALKG